MRSIKKNFALQTAYQILGIITPLITAPYLTRVLGAEKLGIYSYTESIAYYFVLFAMLGLTTYGQRVVARVRENKSELNKVFCEVFLAHATVSILSIGVYIIYCIYFNRQYFIYNIIWIFYVISSFLDVNWFFYGIEEFKLTVTRNFIIKIITVLSIFLFVNTKDDLLLYIAIHSLSFFISQACLWRRLLKTISFVKVSFGDSFGHLKPMILLFMAVIATSIYRMMDKVMLGNAALTAQLGCYDYADRIIRIPVCMITALGTVMLPRMSNLYVRKEYNSAKVLLSQSCEFVFIMCAALAFGLSAISDEFAVVAFGTEFLQSGVLIRILSISIFFMGWNDVIRTQYLIPLGKDKNYVFAVWAGAIVNIIFNVLLISNYGAIGASIATVIAYLTVGLFQTVSICREIPILKYLSKIIVPIINGGIMFVCVRLVSMFTRTDIIGLALEVITGAAVYILLSFVYLIKIKNVFIEEMINKFKNKRKR